MNQQPDSRRNVVIDPKMIELIERVVHDEAKGEGVEGRNAVRAVIYNRIAANRRDFGGGTVLGVLNAPKQFQGVMEKGKGDVRRLQMPQDLRDQYMQEHEAFLRTGVDPTNGATFFQNPEAAKNPYRADGGVRIGNHVFYDNYNGNRVQVPEYNVALRGMSNQMVAQAPDVMSPEDEIFNPPMFQTEEMEEPTMTAEAPAPKAPKYANPFEQPAPEFDPTPVQIEVPNPRATPMLQQDTMAQQQQPRRQGQFQPVQRTQSASQLNPVRMATGGLVDGDGKSKEDTMKTYKYACGGMMAPDMIMGYEEESGNPIPVGSLPSEVADDVPALLSEGEVVIPADVVRWHGLKHIMEMRTEAKMGLMSMAAEGLIQGPGMESDEDYEDEEESEDIETPEGNIIEVVEPEIEEEEFEYEDVDAEYAKDEDDYVGDDEIILLIRKDPSAFKYK